MDMKPDSPAASEMALSVVLEGDCLCADRLCSPQGFTNPACLERRLPAGLWALWWGRGPTLLSAHPKPSLGLFGRLGASDNSLNARTGVKFLESKSQLHRELAV